MDGARYLDEGKLVIYKRNEIYYARSLLSGKYVWRALGTRQLDEAISKGWKSTTPIRRVRRKGYQSRLRPLPP